jgi:hypothetical protein
MTGNPNSNLKLWLAVALWVSALTSLWADDLTLADDARLTGTIRSIDEAGVIHLTSDLSPDPIRLVADSVEKVKFSISDAESSSLGSLVELTNGDVLPGGIENLDDVYLQVMTPDAGRLTIPRKVIKSIQFGVQKRKVIYAGPKSLEEWSRDADGQSGWGFAGNALVANGPARASRALDAPRQFVLKFTLKWQASPSFQVYFADPLTPKTDRVDRYYLQFNGAGMEVKRESSKGKRFQSVILLARTPDQYPASQLDVELRVDRQTSRIHLLLNGEPEGAGIDPVGDPPPASGVSLVNAAVVGSTQEVSQIEVLEWDTSKARHRSEERGDPTKDSLISREDDRWSGSLGSIRKAPEGTLFSFKSDFQDAPLELAESDISTIFFASKGELPGRQDHPFVLRLRGDGTLRVTSCIFSNGDITAQHPLLGSLKFNRAGVTALERTSKNPAAKTESKE